MAENDNEFYLKELLTGPNEDDDGIPNYFDPINDEIQSIDNKDGFHHNIESFQRMMFGLAGDALNNVDPLDFVNPSTKPDNGGDDNGPVVPTTSPNSGLGSKRVYFSDMSGTTVAQSRHFGLG